MITVHSEAVDTGVRIRPATVSRYVTKVLSRHGVGEATVTVIFAPDDMVRKLKATYLHQDTTTDVLAFRLDDRDGETAATKPHHLEGEIYISPARARVNARTYGVTLGNELGRLIFHGCLHLLGYEDDTPSSRARMHAMEDALLEEVSPEDLLAS
ncbi:MAG: rRNA maturation RNase YbeY [Fidelibacterota bacterium]